MTDLARNLKALLCSLLLALAAAQPALAQDYPARPVKLIVGFAPGGGTDYVARAIAQRISQGLGQPVVVENRPGNSGVVGHQLVAKAPPDGYTLAVAAAGAMTIAPNLTTPAPFDPVKDFQPIALAAVSPFVLVIHPSVPAKTLAEFTALARANPGKLNFGSSGTGGAPHLAGELYKSMAKVDIVHVPYKGLAPALTDVLGGQTQAVFADIGLTLKHIEAGTLRPLAVTGARRFPLLPNVPTMAEAGLPGYRAQTWYGFAAPAGTPATVVERLHAEIAKALASPELRTQFANQGLEMADPAATPADFGALIRDDYVKWQKLIREAGIRPGG